MKVLVIAAFTVVALKQTEGQAPDFKVPSSHLSISVELKRSHPFLAEWERCVVLQRNGIALAKDYLFPDTGSGALANLYRVKNDQYLLVDMNGYWFEIDAKIGAVKAGDWHWAQQVAGAYVGCFSFDSEKKRFGFFSPAEMKERSPYLIKDPARYKPGGK